MSRGLGQTQRRLMQILRGDTTWHRLTDLVQQCNGHGRSSYVSLCRSIQTLVRRGLVNTMHEGRQKFVRISVDNDVRQSTLIEAISDGWIKTGDFRDLSAEIGDGSIDLILTDPPYTKEGLPLWSEFAQMAARVLKPGRFLVAYSGEMFLPTQMAMLSEHLNYYWRGTLRLEGQNATVYPRRLFQAGRSFLIYAKGQAGDHRWWRDVLVSPSRDKKYHKWGQSLAPFRQLLEWFSEPGDLVLDPFLGGGTTAVASKQMGRRCIGYELDADMAARARERLANTQLMLPLSGEAEPEQLTLPSVPRGGNVGKMSTVVDIS